MACVRAKCVVVVSCKKCVVVECVGGAVVVDSFDLSLRPS